MPEPTGVARFVVLFGNIRLAWNAGNKLFRLIYCSSAYPGATTTERHDIQYNDTLRNDKKSPKHNGESQYAFL